MSASLGPGSQACDGGTTPPPAGNHRCTSRCLATVGRRRHSHTGATGRAILVRARPARRPRNDAVRRPASSRALSRGSAGSSIVKRQPRRVQGSRPRAGRIGPGDGGPRARGVQEVCGSRLKTLPVAPFAETVVTSGVVAVSVERHPAREDSPSSRIGTRWAHGDRQAALPARVPPMGHRGERRGAVPGVPSLRFVRRAARALEVPRSRPRPVRRSAQHGRLRSRYFRQRRRHSVRFSRRARRPRTFHGAPSVSAPMLPTAVCTTPSSGKNREEPCVLRRHRRIPSPGFATGSGGCCDIRSRRRRGTSACSTDSGSPSGARATCVEGRPANGRAPLVSRASGARSDARSRGRSPPRWSGGRNAPSQRRSRPTDPR